MALVFTDDGGSNTSPYETWAKAATAFLTAVDFASAGDDLIIGHDHSEAPGANTTYNFSTTQASANRVISATSSAGGSTVIYNKADNVQIDLGTGVYNLFLNGFASLWGVSIKIGNDLFCQVAPLEIIFNDSLIEMSRTSTADWTIGNTNGKVLVRLNNTDVNWPTGAVNSTLAVNSNALFEWFGGTLIWTGTQPTAFFNDTTSLRNPVLIIHGVDLSALTSVLFDISADSQIKASLNDCLLNSAVSLTTGTIKHKGTQILMTGCDDTIGNDLYRLDYVDFWGSTVHDDVIYRDSGVSDGTANISWKMVSTANAIEFSEPTKSPPIYAWVDATGSTTFTVNLNWDSASDLQNDEVWLEIEFLEASADTGSAFVDDRMADITATPVDQDNNAESWTGTGGFSNENQQEVSVTVTVNRVGPVIARVCLAKPSTTIYVDPKIVVT